MRVLVSDVIETLRDLRALKPAFEASWDIAACGSSGSTRCCSRRSPPAISQSPPRSVEPVMPAMRPSSRGQERQSRGWAVYYGHGNGAAWDADHLAPAGQMKQAPESMEERPPVGSFDSINPWADES